MTLSSSSSSFPLFSLCARIAPLPLLRLLFVLPVLFVPSSRFVAEATGKGPVGLHAISPRHVAVTTSNIDALYVIDVFNSDIVGHLLLHDPEYNPAPARDNDGMQGGTVQFAGWFDPTGIATCDACDYVYLTSNDAGHFTRVKLSQPLSQMATAEDFSSLSSATYETRPWSTIEGSKYQPGGTLRMIAIKHDGSAAYVADRGYGLFEFDPLQTSGDVQIVRKFAEGLKLKNVARTELSLHSTPGSGSGGDSSGVDYVVKQRYLVTNEQTKLYVIDTLYPDPDENPNSTTTHFDAATLCLAGTEEKLRKHFHFGGVVLYDDYTIYALGTSGKNKKEEEGGRALYKITRSSSSSGGGGGWDKCTFIAGDINSREGWVDGLDTDVRFSRPHSMTLLPPPENSKDGKVKFLILTDIDNRAVRMVNVNDDSPDYGRVSTVVSETYLMHELYGIGPTYNADVADALSSGSAKNGSGNRTMKKKKKQKDTTGKNYEEGSESVAPFLLETSSSLTSSSASHESASSGCSAAGARLCTTDELRHHGLPSTISLHNDDDGNHLHVPLDSARVWTLDSCKSCWLHHPGYCKDFDVDDARYRPTAVWGTNITMVMRWSRQEGGRYDKDEGENNIRVSLECTDRRKSVDVWPVCCGIDGLSTADGAESNTAAEEVGDDGDGTVGGGEDDATTSTLSAGGSIGGTAPSSSSSANEDDAKDSAHHESPRSPTPAESSSSLSLSRPRPRVSPPRAAKDFAWGLAIGMMVACSVAFACRQRSSSSRKSKGGSYFENVTNGVGNNEEDSEQSIPLKIELATHA